MLRRIKAYLFREGRYPGHGVPEADEAFLRDYAQRTNAFLAAGERVPFNIEHQPTERIFDFAQIVPGSVQVEQTKPDGAPDSERGAWLTAEVDILPAVDDGLKARGLSVLLDLGRKIVEHVTVTETPRVGAAAFSNPDDKEHCTMRGSLSHAAFGLAGGAPPAATAPPPTSWPRGQGSRVQGRRRHAVAGGHAGAPAVRGAAGVLVAPRTARLTATCR